MHLNSPVMDSSGLNAVLVCGVVVGLSVGQGLHGLLKILLPTHIATRVFAQIIDSLEVWQKTRTIFAH